MAATARDWAFYGALTLLAATCVFFEIRTVIWWGCRSLMVLAIIVLTLYLLSPLWERFCSLWKRLQNLWKRLRGIEESDRTLSENELETRRLEARRQTQLLHKYKADSFSERVLRPREAARQRRQDIEFKRITGHTPRSGGFRLGGESGSESVANPDAAAMLRKLPGNVQKQTNLPTSSHTTTRKKSKKKLQLPEEPPEEAEGAITLVFRTPQGQAHRRRVLITDPVQLLLDFMTSIGYHQKLYSLALSFPRLVVSRDPNATLRDVTIDRDTTLNIEEKEGQTDDDDDDDNR